MQRMKAFFLVTLALTLTGQTILAQPKLVIAANRFDFGLVAQESTVSQYFWFKSVGSAPVKITRVDTGCDCTTMPLVQTVISPGDSMKVGVHWETGRRIGSTGKYPRIYIEGQVTEERIFLTADVSVKLDSARPVSFAPYKAELARLGAKSVDSVRIAVTNHSKRAISFTRVSEPMSEFRVVAPDSLQPNETSIVTISIVPEFRDKEFAQSVTFAFDGGVLNTMGKITIPVRRKIIS